MSVPFIQANNKIMMVGAENNQADLARMQPTTQAIYDTFDAHQLSATSNNVIPFFQSVNTKKFPFANINQNRLAGGKSFAVQQIYMLIFRKTAGDNPITAVETIEQALGFLPLQKAELTLSIANQNVIERYPLSGTVSPWNSNAKFITPATAKTPGTDATGIINLYRGTAVKMLVAQPIILSDIEFLATVQIPPCTPAAAADTVYIQFVMEGFGTLFTPNGTI
jgi:hypothetical protein